MNDPFPARPTAEIDAHNAQFAGTRGKHGMLRQAGDPPACVECRHYYCGDGGAQCFHDACSTFETTEGRLPVQASAARRGNGAACGIAGRLFERRPEPGWWSENGLAVVIIGLLAIAAVWTGREPILRCLDWLP